LADEPLRDKLEKHLAASKHQGLIETRHDRRILAGDDFEGKIAQSLEEANVILLLVSADFPASAYCYDVEMRRAIERHQAGDARVIPVILRPCDWHDAPFGGLCAAPKDGRPVISWPDLDQAFLDVASAIMAAIRQKSGRAAKTEPAARRTSGGETGVAVAEPLRSSNVRTRRSFTEADRDAFLDEAFEYMAAFFENSLAELSARKKDLTTRFRRVDADRFTAIIYRAGEAVARRKIMRGGMLGNGISFSFDDRAGDNTDKVRTRIAIVSWTHWVREFLAQVGRIAAMQRAV